MRRFGLGVVTVFLCVGTAAMFAQTPAASPASVVTGKDAAAGSAGKRTFEAVSIRPGDKNYFKGFDVLDPVGKMAPKGTLFSWNMQVGHLIRFA